MANTSRLYAIARKLSSVKQGSLPPTCHVVPPAAGTITVNDSLDLLAEFMGCGDSVAAVTNKVSTQHKHSLEQVPTQ
jgi:hypothetical protein